MAIDRKQLGEPFGIVSNGNQTVLEIMGDNRDICVGEVFMIYSEREKHKRIFFFRVLELQNYIRLVEDMPRVAGTMIVEGDAYLAGIERNMLLSVGGRLLGYAERDSESGEWVFKSPRRVPDHLAAVYRPIPGISDEIVAELLGPQVGGDIFVGDLQVGEATLDVPVSIPAKFLPMHVGIFGSTGAGKSNLMMVLIKSILDNNMDVLRGVREGHTVSAFCIDPHDEFAKGIDRYGIQSIVEAMDPTTRSQVIGDFYYLTTHKQATPREIKRYAKEIRILWSEIQPRDLYSIMDFTPQMAAFIDAVYSQKREGWIAAILAMDDDDNAGGVPAGTLRAVQRRLRFVERSPIFQETGVSVLPLIFEAMETGRVLVVNTSLMSDMEQFLLTTIVTRTLSDLRRAVKSSGTLADFDRQAQLRLPTGFFGRIVQKARAFYGIGSGDDAPVRDPRNLPVLLITVEEAPSILNPELMKGQSVFKDISRQGRKFNIGLLVVSQQVSVLDNVILSQMNTEINLRLGNEREIQACIENASVNISGFDDEFRVMGRGEGIVTASYRELPLPVRVPLFDHVFERDRHRYRQSSGRPTRKHVI
ncbi:MAG: ATP-binding protein [Candidatus Thorarchaeota archaeon]